MRHIARGITGQTFRAWYLSDRDVLDAMDVAEFMEAMRTAFLPSTWADDMLRDYVVSACHIQRLREL